VGRQPSARIGIEIERRNVTDGTANLAKGRQKIVQRKVVRKVVRNLGVVRKRTSGRQKRRENGRLLR